MREDSSARPPAACRRRSTMTVRAAHPPLLLALVATLAFALAALAPAANAASQAFTTSVGDADRFGDPGLSSLAFKRVRDTGA